MDIIAEPVWILNNISSFMNVNREKNITAILLAAGASRRMGAEDKLLRQVFGMPLLRHTAAQICASDISHTIVVVRDNKTHYQKLLDGLELHVIEVPEAVDGMSQSLMAGVRQAGRDTAGYLIALADMPDLTVKHYNQIIAAFHKSPNSKIIRPQTADGIFGHPVVFDQCFYDALTGLQGDKGARALFQKHPELVINLTMDKAIITDLDTPQAWAEWERA